FMNKDSFPDEAEISESLGRTFEIWKALMDFIHLKYPNFIDEWSYSTYGWSFRIKDKKRAIIYFLPRDNYFKVAFVFGQKAIDTVMQSHVSTGIKTELSSARVYAEGRGIRIDVNDGFIKGDIEELIIIKLKF
ncbi:MAG: DUF3788 family protein, partial [Bacteroidales bacterium]